MAGVGKKTGKKSPKASPGGSSAGAGGDPGTVAFDAIRVLRKVRVPVQDLSALEARYPPALPRGYREFQERFGPGVLADILHVHAVAEVPKLTESKHGYGIFTQHANVWDNATTALAPGEAERLVVLATSIDGDELTFVAGAPERLLVFPRHRPSIDAVGPTFAHALYWFTGSGRYWEKAEEITFQPSTKTTRVWVALAPITGVPPAPWKEVVRLLPSPRKSSRQSSNRTWIEVPARGWTLDVCPGMGGAESGFVFMFPDHDDEAARQQAGAIVRAMGWKVTRVDRQLPNTEPGQAPKFEPWWAKGLD